MDTESPLWKPHPQALTVVYANLELYGLQGRAAFVGTAGSVIERTNAAGSRFYVHQFYDALRKQRERYLAGPVGDAEADGKANELRARIEEQKAIVPSIRMLGREGFQLVDPRAFSVIATLHNHGLFAAGAILVGSHAYGILLNRLGVRAAPFVTNDVDVARAAVLAFAAPPEQTFLEMLGETGIEFAEVPGLDRKRPATSFKQTGRETFHVDLLVPSRDETYPVAAVPELRAHAVALPYLAYLLAQSQDAIAIMREGCCATRVPLPERFAVHKLVVSQLRTGPTMKADKDLEQAVTLIQVLDASDPGALGDAVAALPKRARRHLAKALARVRPRLEARAPRAWQELAGEGGSARVRGKVRAR